jgi:hypothetical protein
MEPEMRVDEPQKESSAPVARKLLGVAVLLTALSVLLFCSLPAGTLSVWQCRLWGPCATMSEDEFAVWKCRQTARPDLRNNCISDKFQADALSPSEEAYRKMPLDERLKVEAAQRAKRQSEREGK